MTKYVLLTEFFPPTPGGIQQVLESQLPLFGADCTVVTPSAPGAEEFDRRQTYRAVRRSLFSSSWRPSWLWLLPWMRQQSRDTFFVFGHYSRALIAAAVVRALFGRPYGVYLHGHDLLSETTTPFGRWIARRTLRAATWVNVAGSFMAKHAQALGVREIRIVSTFPIVEGRPITPVEHNGYMCVTVGRCVARKNVGTVLKAIAALRPEFSDLEYTVIGDGPELPGWEALAHSLGLHHAVHFVGAIRDQERDAILARSDVGILIPRSGPAGDVEGFGIFFLEAARAGLAVIGGRSGGVSDAVRDGKTGMIVDSDDVAAVIHALRTLLIDQKKRQSFGARGRQLLQREYSLEAKRVVWSAVSELSEPTHPPLSVIIPTYNSRQTIVDTITSLMQQTWRPYEIIIVDDGSTDGTIDALERWKGQITYIQQPQSGAPTARNQGAAAAHGEWYLFCDADIILAPNALEQMGRALMAHPNASYAYSSFRFGPKGYHLFDFSADQLRRRNYIHTTSLIRAAAFPGFDPDLTKFQDWDVWLTMLDRGQTGIWVPQELFRVVHDHGLISRWMPRFVYRLPWLGQGKGSSAIRRYREAEAVIRKKHRLPELR